MGIIKAIKLSSIEDCLKDLIGVACQLKLFQEEYEDVLKQKKDNKIRLSSGNIPRDVYIKSDTLLENERKRLAAKINEAAEKMENTNEELSKLTRQNKI